MTPVRAALLLSLGATGAILAGFAWQRAGVENLRELGIFRYLMLGQDYYAAFVFAAVLVAGLLRPVQTAGNALAAWCGAHPRGVATATTLVLAAGSVLVYHRHPLSMDEFAPLFQSRILLEGRLAGAYPRELVEWLIPAPFRGIFFKTDLTGAVVSLYWPGFALLVAPFTALGAPWLLNPLIGGATVLVMHRLGQRLLGSEAAAGTVVLFTLASPAVTINALSYYSWSAHLLLNACYALLLLDPSLRRALLAGLIGSIALVLHNPAPHLLFALPWIVWLATRPDAARLLPALAAGYLPVCVAVGLGWRMYLRSLDSNLPVSEFATPVSAFFTFWYAISSVAQLPTALVIEARLWGLAKLWLWASPALLLAALWGSWSARRAGSAWRVLAASAALTYLGYFLVRYDQGHGWGFRYFHGAWLVLPLFAAAAVEARRPLAGYLAACALLSLVVLTALRAAQVETLIAQHLAQLPRATMGEARVLIVDPAQGFYAEDLVQNDPFLRNRVLIFATRGAAADEAMMRERFPELSRLPSSGLGSAWGRAAP